MTIRKDGKWMCDNCGRIGVESLFKVWEDDIELHFCYACRKDSLKESRGEE